MKAHSITDLLGSPEAFLDTIFQFLAQKGLNTQNYFLDHICYRVETLDKYHTLKRSLANFGELLTESQVGSRPIASFKLTEPFTYKNRKIDVLELPAPKDGSFYKEGFEHVEFVLDIPFTNFIKRYNHLDFITKDLKKVVNPSITLKEKDFSIKFHQQTLEAVIRYEQSNARIIRKAVATDLPALTTIYNQAIAANQTADSIPLTAANRMPWFETHQSEKYPIFVATQADEILGYATLSQYRGGRPALRYTVEVSYYIHSKYHRKGVGSQLLVHALEAAKKFGFRHAFAILLDTNLPSVRLLEKFGFEQWGHLPNIAVFDDYICGQYYYGKLL